MRAFEDRVVRDTNLQNMAFGNALANLYRKKHSAPIPLWRKPTDSGDVETAKKNIRTILDMEKRDGKSWVDKIWSKHRREKSRRQ